VPNEFFAHHGSLSRDARHYVEHRLKAGEKPTTAVATSTLELGVDIGDVVSVAQIGAPGNVSSIRQRLGRSGRREGQTAILRVLVTSRANRREPSPLDLLEVELVQAAAVIELMLERWVEPPDIGDWHLSTLVQQVLSMIAYRGGQKAGTLYEVLCRKGPWQWVPPELFARILKGMGEADYIQQLPDGELIVGVAGERITSGRDIYSAFETPEYFRVVVGGKELGVLPIDSPLMKGQLIIFAGRRWQVEDIDLVAKVVVVKPAKGGKPPQFSGEAAQVHRRVREKMHEIYRRNDVPLYMEEETAGMLAGARGYFRAQDIGRQPYVPTSSTGYWFVWAEDRVISTLLLALKQQAIDVDRVGPCIEVMPAIHWVELVGMAREGVEALAAGKLKKLSLPYALGKFDDPLPENLLSDAFKSSRVDLERALDYLSSIMGSVKSSFR
jgi:ATP-dependent Lhr-like helicase